MPAYVFRVAPSVKMGGLRHHSGCFAHLLLQHPVFAGSTLHGTGHISSASANLFCLSSCDGLLRASGAQKHSAIDFQIMACNKATFFARQKQRTARNIDRLPQTAQGRFFRPCIGDFVMRERRSCHAGVNGTWQNAICCNAKFAQFQRQGACIAGHAGLGCTIGGQTIISMLRHHRGDIDNAPGGGVFQMRMAA